jgi:hypothetical protein
MPADISQHLQEAIFPDRAPRTQKISRANRTPRAPIIAGAARTVAHILLFLLTPFVYPALASGQQESASPLIMHIAERLAAGSDDPYLVTAYTDRLQELLEDPVALSSPSEKEISRLFFLSDFQVRSLADYIRSSGPVLSVQELSNIPGFDVSAADMAQAFCDFSTGRTRQSGRVSSSLLCNLSFRPGETDTSLAGSPLKMLTKFTITKGSLTAGLTAEKDAGERMAAPLPDFLSGHLFYSGSGFLKRIAAGDYSLRFGQGSAINTAFRPALSLSSPGNISSRDELKPYRSADENNFFRGLAATVGSDRWEMTLFASVNTIDACTTVTPGIDSGSIAYFYTQGWHTTSSELKKKNTVSETCFGANASISFRNARTGLLWSQNRFSVPVAAEDGSPESLFEFSGTYNSLFSAYYSVIAGKILFTGELSLSRLEKTALVQGISIKPSSRLSLNIVYRQYQPGYFAFHSNGPGTGSSTTNEKGLFCNFTLEAARHLFISGGCDVSEYPWLRYMNSSPSRGWRQEIRILCMPSPKLSLDAWYSRRMNTRDSAAGNRIPLLAENKVSGLKLVARYSASENFCLSLRTDYRIADPGKSTGTLILTDLFCRFRRIPLSVWCRYCIFNTDDWNSRIYTYENDLVWSFSIPALSGEGTRSYLMAAWDVGKKTELRIKYSLTSLNRGSFDYNGKDELKFQLRIRI